MIERYKTELQEELKQILSYWIQNSLDIDNGGFVGKIDSSNKVIPGVPKGSVLNSRILWSFSAAYNFTNHKPYLKIAEKAFRYFKNHFIDKSFGGVYWAVDYRGKPFDTKKQFYALSFAIYGLSEYAKCSRDAEAKKTAVELYHTIVDHAYDRVNGGYIEALSREWQPLEDVRLGTKDANESRSMNTHLHILEGFANLYTIWPDAGLKKKIKELICIFFKHIIDSNTFHLVLFFDDEWKRRSNIFSYGHDIEAAWLIQESAEIIGDNQLTEEAKHHAVKIANAVIEGLDTDGGLWYEYEVDNGHLIKEKHSWPQAESMIGFFNAWQITGDERYLNISSRSWQFVKNYIRDKNNGEWFWGVNEHYQVMDQDKVGIWKCPYHNSRACIELIKRIDSNIKVLSFQNAKAGRG